MCAAEGSDLSQADPGGLLAALARFAKGPPRPAVSSRADALTYGDLQDLVHVGAGVLDRETAPGETIGIHMPPSPRAVAALLMARAAGRPTVLLPDAMPPREMAEIVAVSGIRSVVLPEGGIDGWPGAVRRTPVPRLYIGEARGTRSATPLMPAVIQVTSGSLGASRLAVRPWHGVEREMQSVRARLHLTEDDTVVCASSIAHSYGLMGGVLAPLSAGGHVVLTDTVDTDAILSAAPTVLFALARTYALMEGLGRKPAAGIRYALSAGAPLPAGLYGAVRESTGIVIRQDYGTTETGTIAIDAGAEPDPSTVGRPLDHMEVRIETSAEILPGPDECGEIVVRSPAVAAGYLTAAGIEPATDAGWYHTLDAGAFAPDGRLRVGRRMRPALLINGRSVRPDLVEGTLARLPGIREVAVVPVPRHGGTALKAVVATDLDLGEVQARVERALPVDHQSVLIERRDALPRSPAGKVLRKYML